MKFRGEIWWINFDPSVGQEIRKKRPAVILSNDVSNRYLQRYQVVPLSTHAAKVYPSETIIHVAGKVCKAMADQITTVSELRFVERMGRVTELEIKEIEDKVRFQLGL